MTVMVIPETVVMGAGGNDGAEGPDHDAVMEDDGDDGDGGGDAAVVTVMVIVVVVVKMMTRW